MKKPRENEVRPCMYDGARAEIMGNVMFPAGIRLDTRVSRPREYFYTTLRANQAPERGSKRFEERQAFLARNTRDSMPVPSASNHERPKHKRYR